MTRKIAVFTGNRAEYGLLSPILSAIDAEPALELSLVVGGAHLDPTYGRTVDEITGDGFAVAAEVAVPGGQGTARAIGAGIIAMTDALERLSPDICVIYGDRFEAFAALIASTQSNIPTAHIEGGDKTEGGTLDDSVRHAMTKLAHVHLTTNADAAWRVAAMGEEAWRIHDVGLPVLDRIRAGDYPAPDEVAARLGLDLTRPVIVFTQHAIATEADRSVAQLRPSLKAMEAIMSQFGAQVVATYPNADEGGVAMIEALKAWAEGKKNVVLRQSLGRALYHGVLNVAGRVTRGACLGNSSSGLKETPAFGCPALDVGARQAGRLAADNVVRVPNDAKAIEAALTDAIGNDATRQRAATCANPYGDGQTGPRVAKILAALPIGDKALLQKKLTLDP